MKIIYILEKFPSPTEYFVLNEILQFEQRGVEIVLFVLRRQRQYENIDELKNLKATIIYLPPVCYYLPLIPLLHSFFIGGRFPDSVFPSSLIRFLKAIRYYGISQYFAQENIQCDHIHAHFAFIAVDIARYLSFSLKVNYSFSAHAQDIFTNQRKIKQHLPSAKFLITCTDYNRNYISEFTGNVYEDRIHRVYHGIHLEKWTRIISNNKNSHRLKILTIARLVEKKGLIYLIKAVELLIEQGIKVHCVIIGEGLLKSVLENYINTNKLHNFIKLIPFMPQSRIREYYSWADVFVLPCVISSKGDRDGLPNVIVEAMLSGVPVISTPVSAITEVIQHKETGIIVKEKDVQAIIQGIKLLIGNQSLQKYIVLNARRLIEKKLDINLSTEELIKILNKHICQPQTKL